MSEKSFANCILDIKLVIKQCNNKKHSSTKLRPTETVLKKNEEFVYTSLSGRRKKVKPKYISGNLVGTADKKNSFF